MDMRQRGKQVALLVGSVLLSGLTPCVPDDYFFEAAQATRDSFLRNVGIFISDQITLAVLGEIPGEEPTP